MEYKNTIEILTKDIQDIGKLVDGFKNYSSVPSIELDLALSRLRNIYDILLMLRESATAKPAGDMMFVEDNAETVHDREIPETKATEQTELKETEKIPGEKENKQEDAGIQFPENDFELTAESEKVEIPADISPADQKENTSPVTTTKSERPETKKTPADTQQKKSKTTETVLGETLRDNKGYVYDRLGGQTQKPDLTSKMQNSPIKSIAGSIGINDKFFYIRELFNSNAEDFRQAITNLDNAHNFNEAYNYLIEHFDWEMESEPVQQLLNLIRRKFISREDE